MPSRFRDKTNQLLNHGAGILGLDLKYFASGGFWTTLGQGISAILAFILTIAFANLISKETYGLYRYILSIAGIFNIFTLSGMNAAVVQAIASGHEGALKVSVKYQLRWNLMMSAAFFITAAYYLWQENLTFAIAFLILALFSPLTSALHTYGAYLEGKKEFKTNNIFSIGSTAVYVAGMLAALYFGKEIIWLILAYAIATFAANLFFYFRTLRLFRPEGTSSDVLKYGRQLTFIGFIGPIVAQVDSIVLAQFWGPAQLAVYALARAIPDRVVPFIKDLVSLGLPKLVQRSTEDINRVFYRRIFQGALLGAVLSGGYILVSPLVFKYLLPKYLESIFYSQLLSLMFVFAAPLGYMGAAFTSQKMVESLLINSVTTSIIKIFLYIALGIWGGILGLVLAQLIYYPVVFLVNIALWKFKSPAN